MSQSGPPLTALVRVEIYRHFIATGSAPSPADVGAALQRTAGEIEQVFVELAEAHTITLAPSTRTIWMAHPFSATPTPYRVRSGDVNYWANCAWDALGIAAMVERDTECVCRCPDCNRTLDLSVKSGSVGSGAVIHFVVPARRFWDNVAFT